MQRVEEQGQTKESIVLFNHIYVCMYVCAQDTTDLLPLY